jgi:STAM-binding protein
MTNEDELVTYCLAHGLAVLGWIHTHPSQSCFMSSMDLHTHGGFQLTLPEATAIVVAPRDPEVPYALYRLTDEDGGGGLRLIQACQLRGFHPHASDAPIYEQCGHVVLHGGQAGVKLQDLRL